MPLVHVAIRWVLGEPLREEIEKYNILHYIYRIVSVSFRYCLLVILFGVIIFIWKFLKSNFATICESSHLIVTVCKPACLAWHTGTRVDELNGESVLTSENYFDRKNDPICSLSYSFGFTKPLRTRRVYS